MSQVMNRYEGRSVVVTGGAQGLGFAVAQAFLSEGAGVVTLDVEGDTLERALAQFEPRDRVYGVVGDVRRRQDVASLVQTAVDRFGKLDVAVQVAGIAEFGPFLDFPDELWDRIIDVNLRGTLHLIQEAGKVMVAQGHGGAIAVTSSTNAFQPEAGGLAYNTSKSGQVAVMRTAAMELAQHRIRVNALAPGIIETRLAAMVMNDPVQMNVFLDRIPMRRFSPAHEMARPILWMCSDDASYMSGELLVFDGAMSFGLPEPGVPS
jgi:NAD(P)-dependent dehydrogenase (short-subunit alcohol dehydrogenase family)